MTTLVFSHPSSLAHATPPGHPERVDRIKAVNAVLASPALRGFLHREAPIGTDEHARLAHTAEHVQRMRAISPESGFEYIDPDTVMSPAAHMAALAAVGGAVAGVDAVFRGEADNVFVATRPPGHHAEHNRAMGFCFFNHAAIAAKYARERYDAERVAVIDFDVHHGNGTQDIFWSDKSLFYGSTHQMPLYPGSGSRQETGVGNIFNAPLQAGNGTVEFREAINTVILPALELFSPDLIIISAGFDAHERDPLGSLQLTEEDFSWVTLKLMETADQFCSGRVVSVLEGGYDLQGLAGSVGVHVHALMHGNADSQDQAPDYEEDEEEMRMAEANNSDIPALSFEKALQALEEIVSRLEAGKVDLQESITIYERGEALRKHCEDKLKEAEARIEKITLDPSGKPTGTTPLDVE